MNKMRTLIEALDSATSSTSEMASAVTQIADAMELMGRLGKRYGNEVGQDDFESAYEPDTLDVVRLAASSTRKKTKRDGALLLS